MAENPGWKNLKPGNKRGPAKVTKALKEAILDAGEAAGGEGGMTGYLTRMADEQPVAFMGLIGKVLPMQIAGDPESPIRHIIERRIVRPASRD